MPFARYSSSIDYYYGYVPLVDYVLTTTAGTCIEQGIHTTKIQAVGRRCGTPAEVCEGLRGPGFERGLLLRFRDRETYARFRRAQTRGGRSDGEGEYDYRRAWDAVHGESRGGTMLCFVAAAAIGGRWYTDRPHIAAIEHLANTTTYSPTYEELSAMRAS